MDNSKAVQQVTSLLGVQEQPQKPEKIDKTLCIIHKLKKTFFCEDCLFELCFTCREQHERGHTIKFIEETAKFVLEKFRSSHEEIKTMRQSLNDAANDDPTKYPIQEGSVDILEQGNKEIDHIFEKILKHLEETKQEMKERLKEAYIANYKSTLDKRSQDFLGKLDKFETYVRGCITDFEKRQAKSKFIVVCLQRPKVDDLFKNIEKFKVALQKMCDESREFRGEYQLSFKPLDFENNLRELLNHHVNVTFPGLQNGFFQVEKKLFLHQKRSNAADKDQKPQQQQQQQKVGITLKEEAKVEFDPIRSLENEEYDIRRAKEYQQIVPIKAKSNPAISDERYELRIMAFKRDKFQVKIYDSQNKKTFTKDVFIPDDCKRIATKFFSYVNIGRKILMTGGQFVEDKTCSLDCFKIDIDNQTITEQQSYMKVARMHHSMIYIEEKDCVLTVGGQDENQNLLDSCEIYNRKDKSWKMLNTLNQRGNNIGLCKFTKDSKDIGSGAIYIYAFGKEAIERVEITKTPISPRWEELIVKGFQNFPMAPVSFKFDDNLILICGGVDDKNSSQQDIIYFNPNKLIMERSTTAQIKVCDKFVAGSMTQFIVNRMESKILFCSESFVHELEYGAKAGAAKFLCKANLF